jgi:anti-anti-sigma factor
MCHTAKGDCVIPVGAGRLTVVTSDDSDLIVAGDIDAGTAPRLERELARSGPRIVDCAGVTFFGGAGLRVLLAAARRQHDGRLRLRSPSSVVRRVIEVCDQEASFDFV